MESLVKKDGRSVGSRGVYFYDHQRKDILRSSIGRRWFMITTTRVKEGAHPIG